MPKISSSVIRAWAGYGKFNTLRLHNVISFYLSFACSNGIFLIHWKMSILYYCHVSDSSILCTDDTRTWTVYCALWYTKSTLFKNTAPSFQCKTASLCWKLVRFAVCANSLKLAEFPSYRVFRVYVCVEEWM